MRDVIYGVTPGGLYWYRHLGQRAGVAKWIGSGLTHRVAGPEWTRRGNIFGSGRYIYALDRNGQLWWREHVGQPDGSPRWSGERVVNVNHRAWVMLLHVFATGEYIYAVDRGGVLHWTRHLGQRDGSARWAPNYWTAVAGGWNAYVHAFASGEYLYAVDRAGRLRWWRHLGQSIGRPDGLGGQPGAVIGGSGWQPPGTRLVFGSTSYIYRVDSGGALRWYHHLGQQEGTAAMQAARGGRVIGQGWQPFTEVFMTGGPSTLAGWWDLADKHEAHAEALAGQKQQLEAKLNEHQQRVVHLQRTIADLEEATEAEKQRLEQQYREQLAEHAKAQSGTTLAEFIQQSNAEVMQARRQLEETGSAYRLGKVSMALKFRPGPGGTGMNFPQPDEEALAGELSTIELDLTQLEKAKPVSAEPPKVPELSGYSEVVARRKLAAAGVVDVTRYYRAVTPMSDEVDRVVDQIPRPGLDLAEGVAVTIIVGKAST